MFSVCKRQQSREKNGNDATIVYCNTDDLLLVFVKTKKKEDLKKKKKCILHCSIHIGVAFKETGNLDISEPSTKKKKCMSPFFFICHHIKKKKKRLGSSANFERFDIGLFKVRVGNLPLPGGHKYGVRLERTSAVSALNRKKVTNI